MSTDVSVYGSALSNPTVSASDDAAVLTQETSLTAQNAAQPAAQDQQERPSRPLSMNGLLTLLPQACKTGCENALRSFFAGHRPISTHNQEEPVESPATKTGLPHFVNGLGHPSASKTTPSSSAPSSRVPIGGSAVTATTAASSAPDSAAAGKSQETSAEHDVGVDKWNSVHHNGIQGVKDLWRGFAPNTLELKRITDTDERFAWAQAALKHHTPLDLQRLAAEPKLHHLARVPHKIHESQTWSGFKTCLEVQRIIPCKLYGRLVSFVVLQFTTTGGEAKHVKVELRCHPAPSDSASIFMPRLVASIPSRFKDNYTTVEHTHSADVSLKVQSPPANTGPELHGDRQSRLSTNEGHSITGKLSGDFGKSWDCIFTLDAKECPKQPGVHDTLNCCVFVDADGQDVIFTAKAEVERRMRNRIGYKGPPKTFSVPVRLPLRELGKSPHGNLAKVLRGADLPDELPLKVKDWDDTLKKKLVDMSRNNVWPDFSTSTSSTHTG